MSKSTHNAPAQNVQLRQKNVRLGLILLSVVAVFFLGFVAKIVLLSQAH
jgi:hypothetical protein